MAWCRFLRRGNKLQSDEHGIESTLDAVEKKRECAVTWIVARQYSVRHVWASMVKKKR